MLNEKKILLFTAFSFIFLIYCISALEVKKTEFIFTTTPYENLSITVLNPTTNEELQVFAGRARKFGEYKFTYYGTIPSVKISASIVNNETGQSLKREEFGPYNLGDSPININFSEASTKAEELVEEEPIVESNVTEIVPKEGKSKILGFVIGDDGKFRTVYYYVAAAVFGLIVLIIVFRKYNSRSSAPVEPHPSQVVKKTKPAKKEVVVPVVAKEEQSSIGDTEKKIADLQKQLEQIRSEEKLMKLQKQLELERQSLKRMQTDPNPTQQNNNLDNQNKPL